MSKAAPFQIIRKRKLERSIHRLRRRSNALLRFVNALDSRKWFSNVSLPHPRDFSIVRVKHWKTASKSTYSLQAALEVAYAGAVRKAERMNRSDELWKVDSLVQQYFMKKENRWTTVTRPLYLNHSYGKLGEYVGLTAAAIWIDDPEAMRFCLDIIGYFVEGYWPCGWSGVYPHGKLIVY